MKKIGIIGGAGPEAGASLFMHIIRLYQLRGAVQDQDFPSITLLNIPFVAMLTPEDIKKNKTILETQLQEAVNTLASCNVIGIACNTLHTILPAISLIPGNFVHIVSATHNALRVQNITKALFLGTSTSVALKLYEGTVPLVYPIAPEQKEIDQIIIDVLANNFSGSEKLAQIIAINKQRETFDGIILGCTELPLLNEKKLIATNIPLFDTISILAREIVNNHEHTEKIIL